MKRKLFLLAITFLVFSVLGTMVSANQVELVTENRIGYPDAELVLTMEVLPTYFWTAPYESRANYLKEAMEAWARRNPNVQIRVSILSTNINEAMVRVLEQAKVGRASDLVHIDSFFLPRFYDHLQPLDSYLTEAEKADYFDFVREGMTNNQGEIAALWTETDVRGLYYRRDLVPNPPKTWEELIAAAKKISNEEGIAGYLFPAGRGEGTVFSLLPFFWAQGGKLIDESGQPVFNEGQNRQYLVEILNFMKRLIDEGASPSRVTAYRTLGDFNAEVAARQVAMFPGGNWQKNMFYDMIPEEEADQWDIAPFPQVREGISSSGSGGWAWGIFSEDPDKVVAAVEFVKDVYENPRWHELAGPLPSKKSAYAERAFYATDEYAQKFAGFLQTSGARPGLPIYSTISTELQVAVSDVITGSKTPEAALDLAWKNVMQEYDAQK